MDPVKRPLVHATIAGTDSGTSRIARIDQLLDAALELEGEERARFLASDSVEAELRDELAALLNAAGDTNLLERPPPDLHSAAAELFGPRAIPSTIAAGQRIGRYRLIRLLGEGGMATVWLGERFEDTFSHNVAVKCLKTGLVTAERRARFLREQQILGQLQHLQIARLYDAGISTDGVPFIVMEWVDGPSLTGYCDQQRLGIEQRLQLFRKVCSAVAFAHQNLIVHRDLKPGNILVGGDGEPKLLDFGIAKLIDDDTEPMTRTGAHLFTPDYASPEQLRGASVTTATDIYALGIILYELLCGMRPRQIASQKSPSGAPLLIAPSEALRRLSATSVHAGADTTYDSTRIAGARMSTPDRLCEGLRGDLDTIVLKASQEEPSRRYSTVTALSEDIQRFLKKKPISARRDSRSYRARLFLRRNTLAVAATFAVMFALVGGLFVSIWQARIAGHERERAELERQRAEQRFEDVRGLAHAMIFDLHDELVKLPGSTAARSLLVKQALIYLQRLGDQSDASIPLRRELAEAWLRVGDVQGAPGMPNLGDAQGALLSYAQATARIDSVLREAPRDPEARKLWAEILLRRASAQFRANELTESDASYLQAIALWTQLRREGVRSAGMGLANSQQGLGNLLAWSDKQEEALVLYTQAKATAETAGPGDGPTGYEMFLATNEVALGDTLDWLGRHAEATGALQHALGRLQALQRSQPDDPRILRAIAGASMRLGDNMYGSPDKASRLAVYQTALTATSKLAAADPADMRAKRDLAQSETDLGDALVDLKRYDEALQEYRTSLQVQQELLAHNPGDQETRQDMGNTLYGIADMYRLRDERQQAATAYRQTLDVRQALLATEPNATASRRDVAQVLGDLAAEEEPAQSCRHWIASDTAWQSLVSENKIAPTDQADVAKVHKHAADCH